jgi:hypothetical protein
MRTAALHQPDLGLPNAKQRQGLRMQVLKAELGA